RSGDTCGEASHIDAVWLAARPHSETTLRPDDGARGQPAGPGAAARRGRTNGADRPAAAVVAAAAGGTARRREDKGGQDQPGENVTQQHGGDSSRLSVPAR